jgi:hypothetical protein
MVAETRFGANAKFSSSGERLWLIGGGWLADDPTELVTGSIYRRARRWPVNFGRTRGGRRERRTLAQVNPWLMAWQPPRRRWDSLKVSWRCGGKREPRGAWPGGSGRWRVNPLSRKEGERATGSHRSDLQLTVGENLLPCVLICPSRAQVGPATARITAELVVGGGFTGDLIHSGYCIIRSSVSVSCYMPDRATSELFFSRFSMAT